MFSLSSLLLNRENGYFILICIAINAMPWSLRISTLSTIALIIYWFLDKDISSKLKSVFKNRIIYFILPFIVIHFLWLIGTNNWAEATHTIEVKMGLLFLPIIFFEDKIFKKINYNSIFKLFTINLLAVFIYLLYFAFINYSINHNISTFFYSYLSVRLMHPGYLSAFYFGIFIWSCQLFLNSKKYLYFGISFLFLIFIIMLNSKTIYLCLLIAIIAFLYYKKNSSFKNYIFSFIIGSIFCLSLYQIPFINFRVNEAISSFQFSKKNTVKTDDSSPARLVIWNGQASVIKKHPIIGSGTGNGNDELHSYFRANHYDLFASRGVNSHNQFLHQWMEQGILGILSLVVFLIGFLMYFIKQKNTLGIIFIAVHFIILNTDIMFEIQAGTLFFAYFSSIFLVYNPYPHLRGIAKS